MSDDEEAVRPPRHVVTASRFDATDDVAFDTMIGAANLDDQVDSDDEVWAPDALDEDDEEAEEDSEYERSASSSSSAAPSALERATRSGSRASRASTKTTLLPMDAVVGNVQRVAWRDMKNHLGALYYLLVFCGVHRAVGLPRRVSRAWSAFVLFLLLLRWARSASSSVFAPFVFGLLVVALSTIGFFAAYDLVVRRRLLLRAVRVHYVFEKAFHNRKLTSTEAARQRKAVTEYFRRSANRITAYVLVVASVVWLFYNVPRIVWLFDPNGYESPDERRGADDEDHRLDGAITAVLTNRGMHAFFVVTDLLVVGLPAVAVAAFSLVYGTVSHQRMLISSHQMVGDDDGGGGGGGDDEDGGGSDDDNNVDESASPAQLDETTSTSWRARVSFAYRLSFSLHERATRAIKPFYAVVGVFNVVALSIFGAQLLVTSGEDPKSQLIFSPAVSVIVLAWFAEYVAKLHRQSLRVSAFLGGTLRGVPSLAQSIGSFTDAARSLRTTAEMYGQRDEDVEALGAEVVDGAAAAERAPPSAATGRTLRDAESGLSGGPSLLRNHTLAYRSRVLRGAPRTKALAVDRATYVSQGVSGRDLFTVLLTMLGHAAVVSLIVTGVVSLRLALQYPECDVLSTSSTSLAFEENTDSCSSSQVVLKNVESAFIAQPLLWSLPIFVFFILFGVRPFLSRLFGVLVMGTLMIAALGVGLYFLYEAEGHGSLDLYYTVVATMAIATMASLTASRVSGQAVYRYLMFVVLVVVVGFALLKALVVRFVDAEEDSERLAYVVVGVPVLRFVCVSTVNVYTRKLVPRAYDTVLPVSHLYVLPVLPMASFSLIARLFIYNISSVGSIVFTVVLVSAQEFFMRATSSSRFGVLHAARTCRWRLRSMAVVMERHRTSDILADSVYMEMMIEHFSTICGLLVTVVCREFYGQEVKLGSLTLVFLLMLVAELATDYAATLFEEGMMDVYVVGYLLHLQSTLTFFLVPLLLIAITIPAMLALEMSAIVQLV